MKKIHCWIMKCLSRIKPLSAAAFAAFVTLALIIYCGAVPLNGETELYSNVIRLHIPANSDSDEDQAIKLAVRDKVTEFTTELLDDCSDLEAAKRLISENSGKITEIARACIAMHGKDYGVSFSEGYEIYPRRAYGSYTFPAGRYYSVRLELGSAKGRNWWCVLFPPMCLGAAVEHRYGDTQALREIGFTDSEIDIITEEKSVRTEVRFFILDLINSMK